MKKLFALGALCALTATASFAAQATLATRIHYDGEIAPRGDLTTLLISVYADKDSSEALWSEEQVVKVDHKGKFALDIGATLDSGIPAEVFASASGRWVGIAVKGESEQPRIMIVSVPYAVKARDAEMIGGRAASEFVREEDFTTRVRAAIAEIAKDPIPAPQVAPQQGRRTIFNGLGKQDSALTKVSNIAVAAAGTFEYLPTTGNGVGVLGRTNSVSGGSVTSAASGVLGEVISATTGPYVAGVRGLNFSPLGQGVLGYHDSDGTGVYGEAQSGYGVFAKTNSGTALYAFTGTGTIGLELYNGALKVSGPNKTAFILNGGKVFVPSLGLEMIPINSAYSNGDPNAIVSVTPLGHYDALYLTYYPDTPHPIYVVYVTELAQWCILNADGAPLPANARFSVVIIKTGP